MVATGHRFATDAALDVLRAGGNAADAAVCAAVVLAVVAPHANTLGGEMYALVYEPQSGVVTGVNGTGRSPQAATAERFPHGVPRTGIDSATVPGFLRGIDDLQRRYGTWPLARLLQPAIALARGFAVYAVLAENTRERCELLARDPAAQALFLPGGVPLAEGDTLRQPDLERVLQTIAVDGVDAFYNGELAERIAAACNAAGGLVAIGDLAGHTSLWQAPLRVPFYGTDVWTMPPNSYGATLLLQLLDLAHAQVEAIDTAGVAFIEAGYVARQRAYATASEWIADPEVGEVAARAFCDRAAERAAYEARDLAAPEPRDRCTTNVVAIDASGLAVSLVESISAPYGAGVVLDGLGILLNNRMAGFAADPGHPNALAPGKRPANTLAPAIVTRNERLVMALGTPGTVGQTCTLAQFLARVLASGELPAAAVAQPRWSVDFQGKLVVEDTMDEDVRSAVLARFPEARVMPAGWISFGSIKLAAVEAAGYLGVADDRRAATTAGW